MLQQWAVEKHCFLLMVNDMSKLTGETVDSQVVDIMLVCGIQAQGICKRTSWEGDFAWVIALC